MSFRRIQRILAASAPTAFIRAFPLITQPAIAGDSCGTDLSYTTFGLETQGIRVTVAGITYHVDERVNLSAGDWMVFNFAVNGNTPAQAFSQTSTLELYSGSTVFQTYELGPFPTACLDGYDEIVNPPHDPVISVDGCQFIITFTADVGADYTLTITNSAGVSVHSESHFAAYGDQVVMTFNATSDDTFAYALYSGKAQTAGGTFTISMAVVAKPHSKPARNPLDWVCA